MKIIKSKVYIPLIAFALVLITSCSVVFVFNENLLEGFIKNKDYIKDMYSEDELMIEDNQLVLGGKAITDTEEIKSFPVLSPDRKKIAYFVSNDKFGYVIVLDINTKESIKCSLENVTHSSCNEIYWIYNNLLVFNAHVNPSLEVSCIFDATDGHKTNEYYGIGFVWDKAKNNIYYCQPPPHFSDIKGIYKIYQNEEIIFQTGEDEMLIGGPAISDIGEIAFFEKKVDGTVINLVLAQLTNNGVEVKKKDIWNGKVGKISLDEGTIRIEAEGKNFKYSRESFVEIK